MCPLSRVWRYRGGRDGHETLQQFMNFLGREQVAVGDVPHLSNGGDSEQSSANGEREKKPTASKVAPRLVPNPYAGVVVFCVPMATVVGEDIDVNSFQVWVLFLNGRHDRCCGNLINIVRGATRIRIVATG